MRKLIDRFQIRNIQIIRNTQKSASFSNNIQRRAKNRRRFEELFDCIVGVTEWTDPTSYLLCTCCFTEGNLFSMFPLALFRTKTYRTQHNWVTTAAKANLTPPTLSSFCCVCLGKKSVHHIGNPNGAFYYSLFIWFVVPGSFWKLDLTPLSFRLSIATLC